MSEGIIIQLIISVGGVIGAYLLARQQWRKDRVDNELSREQRLDKREADFWKRAEERDAEKNAEIAELAERIVELENNETTLNSTITEQGALIMELREKLNKQDDRIRTLENENGRLKAENERLKGGGKKGM